MATADSGIAGKTGRLARRCTHHRCYYRTAGPKEGVHVPFSCPVELEPVDIILPASNTTATGRDIRQREVFAVAGSNAEGKTSFLEDIIAGMDDHAAGGGRERVVTIRVMRTAETMTMNCELAAGADVSTFFRALPPGIGGTVSSASGMGSGSMTMAHQIGSAIRQRAPLLIIDEERAAPNLLVASCLQNEEVTPLAAILARDRIRMSDTTLVFAACAMDTLAAQADRIMVLDRHVAGAIDRAGFRRQLVASLHRMADDLS